MSIGMDFGRERPSMMLELINNAEWAAESHFVLDGGGSFEFGPWVAFS